ncbi:MAG: single-stranded-DNA-specific exonuclease RecJ [Christensenellaceae bacterium]|jgi:single-stranded-DNA-specific exonuclease|nr:single-stranded-DNA-specific exonuclease RecJ [Christensenellaceae bacterium]
MKDLTQEISKTYNLNDIVTQLLVLRGVDTKEKVEKFLNPSFDDFHDPFRLRGMKEAVSRVEDAIKRNQKVLIFGDYDVDGVSATAILMRYFKDINFAVDFYLPNRYIDGYGLTCAVLDKIKQHFCPDLIITVDCGISCHKEVEHAKTLGIEIIITDHHEIPETIPKTIVIDPKLPGQEYPFDGLCGAGVALKFVQALSRLEQSKKYLAICAVATIADIVPLLGENRAITAIGLKMLKTLPTGVKMLMQRSKMDMNAGASDVAFKLAPKINAAGRMGDASVALNLYLNEDKKKLEQLVQKLINLNTERQGLCNAVYEEAQKRLNDVNLTKMRSIVLYSKDWDSGIVGIVAARLAEEYNKPTVLMGEAHGFLKGSARSINDIDICSIISNIKETVETFGGHKMAAGLTVKKENIDKFIKSLNSALEKEYTAEDYLPKPDYDMTLNLGDINEKLISDLNVLEPCGCGNPKPAFSVVLSKFTVGPMPNNPSHITMMAMGFNVVAFGASDYVPVLKNTNHADLSLELQSHVYNGRTYIKGVANSIRIGRLTPLKSEDFAHGVYLKQFVNQNAPHSDCEEYDKAELDEIIKQAEKNKFGTLFVVSRNQTYNDFAGFEGLRTYMLEVVDKSGLNAVVLSWTGTKNLNCFDTVVCLDPVLSQNYINTLGKYGARIYIPKTKFDFDKEVFTGLEFGREIFLDYFKMLKSFAAQRVPVLSEVYLYKRLKALNPHKKLSFKQFIYCLYSFLELEIFEPQACDGGFLLKEKKSSTALEKSEFYNTIKLIIMSI